MMTTTLSTHKVVRPVRTRAKPEVMERLFNRLIAFYGTKFTDTFAGVSTEILKDVWAEELGGYSLDEINSGVQACRQLKWPPTLPEFMNYCRPPVSVEAAYYEAAQNIAERQAGKNPKYTHPAIYWAGQEIGPWDMKMLPQRVMAARWSECLQRHLARGEWQPVPDPPLQLAEPETSYATGERRAMLEALRNDSRNFLKRRAAPEATEAQEVRP